MIYDAQTNPRGFKLSIQAWPRDTRIRVIARQQGYRLPAHTFVAPEATPARALLNHGVWRAWCPDCPFAAEDVWRGYNLFWCMRCGNLKAGRAWRPLTWPENWQQIQADLDAFPSQAQNWEPWGAAVDHVAVAQDWVAHAGVMIDPEHGLSDNDVGGLDDPETYTTPVLAVTNAIIASSDANVDKGDIRYFRQFMPADPAGSGYWLQSSSTSAAGWVARATAFASAVAELTSLTLLCDLTFGAIKGLIFRGNGGATPSSVRDYAAQGLVLACHNNVLEVYDQALSTTAIIKASLPSGPGSQLLQVGGQTVWHAGNDGASSGLYAQYADDATKLGGVAAAGYQTALGFTPPRMVASSYSGNNGTDRQITTGFICKYVEIIAHPGGTSSVRYSLLSATAANNGLLVDTPAGNAQFGAPGNTRLHASDGFIVDHSVDASNASGTTYYYVAYG